MAAFLLSWISSALITAAEDPPSDPATDLLKRYLAIRTDHPEYGTEEAALFLLKEAEKEEIEGATWSIDPSRRCVHFVGVLRAPGIAAQRPLLLVHHGDTMPANASEWSTPPFEPTWIREQTDWYMQARGAIDDKGHGVAHWMTIKKLRDSPVKRTRDVYFIMNCGEEVGDPLGAVAFVHFLIQPLNSLPQTQIELSTSEKLETGKVMRRFRSLTRAEWMWNEGSFGSTTEIAPYTLAPIATAQKGFWRGQIKIEGPGGHSALNTAVSPLEAMVGGMDQIYSENRKWSHRWKSLHYEMQEMVRTVAKTRPFYERWMLNFYPRLFFELFGMQTMVTSWWQPAIPGAADPSLRTFQNIVPSQVSTNLEYRFLGDKTPFEIEESLKEILEDRVPKHLKYEVKTLDHIAFRRDFFEGLEADHFRDVLSSYPKVMVTPFITPGVTDSRYYRLAGVRAFDFVPLFLTRENIRTMHGKDERIPRQELFRAIDIEFRILERLVQ